MILLWLATAAIAAFFATRYETAALVDGSYIPAGNDSFYHARRILDAVGERGFYQFDPMIHVPEGSWINWPWAYDGALAGALALALAIQPGMEPMAFLAWVPVAWLLVNSGLLLLICRRAGLGLGLSAVVMLGFATLPLTQVLHGLGVIDHHFIELTFVLAATWSGLRFFADGSRNGDAILLGVVLGIAPGFHNGLFLLQLPVLLTILLGWVTGRALSRDRAWRLAGALFGTTLLVALPSEPLYDLQFEFWTLSWFHVYAALCTATCILLTAYRPYSPNYVAVLGGVATALAIPILARLFLGTAFLSGELILLDHVLEVRSPLSRLAEPGGWLWLTSFYSWLFVLIPAVAVYFARSLWQHPGTDRAFLGAMALFGLALLLMQFRLHPFGTWPILVGGALLVRALVARTAIPTIGGVALALLVLAVSLQPPLKYRLFQRPPPGLTRDYAIAMPLFEPLAEACHAHSGPVLSYNDDGHYVRYHTECSVLTNNFLMTPQHEEKIKQADRLLQMTPEEFVAAAPDVDYLFVRMYGIYSQGPEGLQLTPVDAIRAQNAPLFAALTFDAEVPGQFQLIGELRVEDERDFAYASIYRVRHDE